MLEEENQRNKEENHGAWRENLNYDAWEGSREAKEYVVR